MVQILRNEIAVRDKREDSPLKRMVYKRMVEHETWVITTFVELKLLVFRQRKCLIFIMNLSKV